MTTAKKKDIITQIPAGPYGPIAKAPEKPKLGLADLYLAASQAGVARQDLDPKTVTDFRNGRGFAGGFDALLARMDKVAEAQAKVSAWGLKHHTVNMSQSEACPWARYKAHEYNTTVQFRGRLGDDEVPDIIGLLAVPTKIRAPFGEYTPYTGDHEAAKKCDWGVEGEIILAPDNTDVCIRMWTKDRETGAEVAIDTSPRQVIRWCISRILIDDQIPARQSRAEELLYAAWVDQAYQRELADVWPY